MNSDFIEIYDDALSKEKCREIISYFDKKKKELGRGVSGRKKLVDLSAKSCWELPAELTYLSNRSFLPSRYILDVIKKCTPQYIHSYPYLKDDVSPWNVSDGYNIQMYNPGEAYWQLHCENGSLPFVKRVLVWTVYLNTVTDNGGTYFDQYDKTVDAKEGRFVMWPAGWTHTHKGIVSNTQKKYIATGGYEFLDDQPLIEDTS